MMAHTHGMGRDDAGDLPGVIGDFV
jgi:hypothetical protein